MRRGVFWIALVVAALAMGGWPAASVAGPASTSTTARASMARRSGWLSAAPTDPTSWNAARPAAVSHTPERVGDVIAVRR
jgi:hypothetical protein